MAITHFLCGMIYLGIAFGFQSSGTHAYIAWFVISAVETILNLGLSLASEILSFRGTHLTKRMMLLTFIIIGEGVIVVCKVLTIIVNNSGSWSKQLSMWERICLNERKQPG